MSFIAYWISDAFKYVTNPGMQLAMLNCNSAATWQFASSILAIGLTWRESLAIVAVGFFIVSIVISLNGVAT